MANILTEKIGPLPTWGYLGIATAMVGGWALYSRNKTASTATATPATGVPDYIFQVQNQIPPEAPPPSAPPGQHGRKVKVPAVTGKSYTSASGTLIASGLYARRAEKYVGIVRSQMPAAGTEVAAGSTVVLSGKAAAASKHGKLGKYPKAHGNVPVRKPRKPKHPARAAA